MAKKSSKGKGGGKAIPKVEVNLKLSPKQGEELLRTLKVRFEENMERHEGLEWAKIEAKLEAHPEKLASLKAMESTGGEPDLVGYDKKTGEYIFYDCAAQSPDGRRSICYDGEAQAEREKKGVHPAGNAVDIAAEMGIELLNEEQYRALQELGEFDTTTSSWIETPADIRKLGGAIFADLRYGQVFVYHNSAPSFYSARGFRGSLRV
jgi:class 3 adenylate cyclase